MANSTAVKLAYDSSETRFAVRNIRSVKSRSASIGADWPSSTRTRATNAATPAAPVNSTGSDRQPSVGPWDSA